MIHDSLIKDFPIFNRKVGSGKDLVYLDNAATTQKPQVVVDALVDYYQNHNANIHRGVHTLSEEATERYEAVRGKVQKFIGARLPSEIIFTSGTTEAINLVSYTWGRQNINAGDEILLTEMEHHANLIPWQILAKEKQAVLRFIPVTEHGLLDFRNLTALLNEKTKLVAMVHASNFLGTLNDLSPIVKRAKKLGVPVLLDAAQSAPHLPLNVQKLGVDFLAFSAHKMLGPTGVGVLYIKDNIAQGMAPFLTGGGMIKKVSYDKTEFQTPPHRFEAGTPNIAGVIGLGAALDYLEKVGFENLLAHERELVRYLLEKLGEIGGVTVYGSRELELKVGVVSFSVVGIHSHDLATLADEQGVAIRSGHHCAQPLHQKMGINESARASFYLYNSSEDVDRLIEAIKKARKLLF